MKTSCILTKTKDIKRRWYLIDMKDKTLGRVATNIARLLIGKAKPYYVPHLDCGDYVIAINSAAIRVSGKKEKQKVYMHYSGYPGGLKRKSYEQVKKENQKRIVKAAVSGMLPKNKLHHSMLNRFYIYPDSAHEFINKTDIIRL